jgi:hypothetical protein
LQGVKLNGAELQGAYLGGAQLQGASLDRAQLQGAELRGAQLWNATTDDGTEIGLADLRRVSAETPDVPELVASLPLGTPSDVGRRLTAAPSTKATAPFAPASTKRGKVLLDQPCDGGNFLGVPCERTTTDEAEYLRQVIPLWIGIARADPASAESIASRALPDVLPLGPPLSFYVTLACRLLDEIRAGSVRLRPATIRNLTDRAGASCASPTPDR